MTGFSRLISIVMLIVAALAVVAGIMMFTGNSEEQNTAPMVILAAFVLAGSATIVWNVATITDVAVREKTDEN